MDAGEKEIAALMKEWKDEIVKLTHDYSDNITKLDKLRVICESTKSAFWKEYKALIYGGVSIFILCLAFIVISRFTQWCSITLSLPPKISASDCKK